MCGIAGFFSLKNTFNKEDLIAMTSSLANRGPDAEGYFMHGSIGLGHRRLSILDLSNAANQPFFSADGRFVVVFNGEIFNFKEIAAELNIPFKTSSDTEVLLEAFVRFGPAFVDKLNGMFAFVIYDIRENSLHAFRDRLGVKPLFYYWDGKEFLFASEIKAIKAVKKISEKLKLDHEAINNFLYLGYIPQPWTIYKDVRKFPAGAYLKLNVHEFDFKIYWSLEDKIKKEKKENFTEVKENLKNLLESSVRYRLISDVPVGTFLSGGIDSSLITAIAQKQYPGNINTFSIGFREEKYNELPYAGEVAKYLKTNHYEFLLSFRDAIDMLEGVMDNYDEPYADASAIPTYLVSKMARKYVTVTLSGDGGDELFHGYGRYLWSDRLSSPYIRSMRKTISVILRNSGNMRMRRVSNIFNYPESAKFNSHLFSQEQQFYSEAEIRKVLLPAYHSGIKLEENYKYSDLNISDREGQALFDLKYYLKDDLLVKVDRASMLCSLEARTPFLDYRVVEYALNISPSLKIKNGVQKNIIKEVLYDYVPRRLFEHKKWGFALPIEVWLKKELKFLIEDFLSEQRVNEVGILNYSYVRQIKDRFLKGESHLFNRLWTAIILQRWMIRNNKNHS